MFPAEASTDHHVTIFRIAAESYRMSPVRNDTAIQQAIG